MARSLIFVHIATVLLGFVGITVQSISADSFTIVAGRGLFEFLAIVAIFILQKKSIRLQNKQQYLQLGFLGLLQAFQWLTFFIAIKESTVAIALVSLFTFPFFTALLEPTIMKEKFRTASILLSFAIIPGVLLLVPNFSMQSPELIGIFWGVISALLVALIFIFSRKWIIYSDALLISFYKSSISMILFLPVFFLTPSVLSLRDTGLLALLGILFTALPYLLVTIALREIKSAVVTRIISFEPVYGILLAVFFLSEIPDLQTLLGAAIILSVALYSSIRS